MDKPMATDVPVVPAGVPCTVCQHDIPLSEALVAEAMDYVIYFCSLDCYARWRSQLDGSTAGSAAPTVPSW